MYVCMYVRMYVCFLDVQLQTSRASMYLGHSTQFWVISSFMYLGMKMYMGLL
jgi:hypothetical protein